MGRKKIRNKMDLLDRIQRIQNNHGYYCFEMRADYDGEFTDSNGEGVCPFNDRNELVGLVEEREEELGIDGL